MAEYIEELELPSSSFPNFSYETSLGDQNYKLNFKYLTRSLGWYLSISDLAGNLLLSNTRLIPWLNLLIPYVDTTLPQGSILLVPISTEYPTSPEITLENLSSDFQLVYILS